MSTIDPMDTMAEPWDVEDTGPPRALLPRTMTAIVPSGSISGRALTAVVAIMTFLAALTAASVVMVVRSAADWQSAVAREATIQVRPETGRNIEADVQATIATARGVPGIADVRAYTKQQSEALVEPWLGTGLALDDLPIPRLIVIKLAAGATPDFAALRAALKSQVPSAVLDDHRGWIDRMRNMAEAAVVAGLAVLALVVVVTMLSVTFATRGAMAANRPIVEVLHYIGATDGFVARQFQRHFLALGLKGGAIGGGAALILSGILAATNGWLAGTAGGAEAMALFGSFSIGGTGYGAIIALIVLMAAVTALTSRRAVGETLRAMD